MSLYEKINEDLKKAMKAGEKEQVGIFRMLLSEVKKAAIDQNTRDDIKDDLVIGALTKGMKSRKESVKQYKAGGREDLAAKEEAEIDVIKSYLPQPLSEEELDTLIDAAISELGAAGKKNMGQVMKTVVPRIQGRADGRTVQQKVIARLTSMEG